VAYVIRSPRTGTADFLRDVQQTIWSVNPNLPLAEVRTVQDLYERSMARTSFALTILSIAAGMALLLGIVGIYGVISYSVSQRTREIGIRMALGADQSNVRRMFLRHGLVLTAVGVALGIAASIGLTRWMASLLFEVRPIDPVTYSAVAVVLLAAALSASYLPARRATAVEPVEALRAD
jgi:ABC-type antimicrobial peptide transport system permease subunit